MTDINIENEKRQEFTELLFDLSKQDVILKDGAQLRNFYDRFEELYKNDAIDHSGFRHYYSDIFSVLTSIQDNNFEDQCTIDELGQKLQILKEKYIPSDNMNDISDSLNKLYDHASLDIARLTYINGCMAKKNEIADAQSKIADAQSKINSLVSALAKANKDLSDTQTTLKNAQREYIAILGIFSAFVLSFIGEIAFSTSVLQNLHRSSIYRIVLSILLIGLVVFNTMFILFDYTDKLVRGTRGTKMRLIRFVNFIFLVLIFVVFIFWHCGVVERRNQNIHAASDTITSSESSRLICYENIFI